MSLQTNLIAKYDLNSDGNDSVGSADLTLNNVNINVSSSGRDCAHLNGYTAEIIFPDGAFWESGDATLSFWVNSTDQDGVLYQAREPYSGGSQSLFKVEIQNGTMGSIFWRNSSGTNVTASSNTIIEGSDPNYWTHIAFVKSGSDLLVYINGVLDTTLSNIPTTGLNFPDARIGSYTASSGAGTGMFLGGSFDDIRIWSRALDASEVSSLHSGYLTTLIAHYTFDDLSNTTGNADYDLVAYDGASVSNGTLLLSQAGSGVYPTNEIVTDPSGGNRFTVSMWFKDLADRSTRQDWMQFLADHQTAPAGMTTHQGVGNYLAAIYDNDELGVFDEVGGTWVSTGFQMLSANFTGWHHLTLVHDDGTTTFYVDGVQAGVPVNFTASGVIQVFGSFGITDLGGGNTVDPINSPASEFDNIRVYSGLLSASEISDLYTQETPVTLETGLIAKFDLDNATESIGGHTGVLGNQTPAAYDPKFISDGTNQYLEICERGQGLTFSGTGLLEDLAYTKSHSISAWVAIPEYVSDANRINYFGNDAASIFCKGNLAAGGNVLSMALEQGYPLLWHRKPSHGAFTQSTTQIPLNTWTHLLVTIEGGHDNVNPGIVRWYVNGQPAGEGSQHPGGWFGVSAAESANQDIVIGGAPVTNQFGSMRFLGSIDDVRVWDRTLSPSEAGQLYGGGRGPYQGHCPMGAGPVYDTLLGIHGTGATYSLPSPHGGWVAVTADGKSYESNGGQDGTWAGPHGIAGSTATATSTRPVIEAGGFWFTTLHGDSQSMFGSNNHIAYANALDTNGGKVLPSHNGWVQMTDDGSEVDIPRALYTDGTCAYYTAVNDDVSIGAFQNRLYKASVATDSSSVPTWSQLNANATWNGKSVTHGLGHALAIKFGAAHGTKHVWVCKDQNDAPEFGSAHIVVYDMANGEDVINSTLANVPSGSVNMGKPIYCAYSGAWYVPCKDAILKSTDGGLNWTSTAVTFVGSPMQEIDGIATTSSIDHTKIRSVGAGSNGTLIAVGEFLRTYSTPVAYETKGLILRSEDGITWNEVAEHTDPLYDVAVADQGVWMVVGDDNAIGFSDTDGVSWETVEYAEDQNDTPINSIFSLD